MTRVSSPLLFVLKLTAFLLIVIGLAACETRGDADVLGYGPDGNIIEGEVIDQSVHPVLDSENNRLVFKNQEQFDDFMQGMSKVYTNDVGLDILENELGFRSFRRHINDLRTKLDEYPHNDSLTYFEEYHKIEALDTVSDPAIATILNPEGEVQIGGTIHKVGKNFVHSVDNEHKELLKHIDNFSNISYKNEHVDVFLIERQSNTFSLNKIEDEVTSRCEKKYNSNKYRINGKSWIESFSFVASAGTETLHYKRKNIFGKYSRRNVNEIKVTTTVNLYHSNANGVEYHQYTNLVIEGTNLSKVYRHFISGAYANYGISGSISSTHYVKRGDNGATASCTTGVYHQ